MRLRGLLTGAVLALLVIAFAATAFGFSQPPPTAGAWKLGTAEGGFQVVGGKGKRGKLFVTGIHTITQNYVHCPDDPQPVKVDGRLPLKLVPLAGYPGYKAWGVGKTGSTAEPGIGVIPARVSVAGKPVKGGSIKVEFSSVEPGAIAEFRVEFTGQDGYACIVPGEGGKHA